MTTSNNIALVTGSTSGIGLAIAQRLLAQGDHVAFNSFEPATALPEAVTALLDANPERARYFQADLAAGDAGVALVRAVIAAFGRLDVLINNAGVQKVAPVEALSAADWDRVTAVSLDAAFHTIRTALPGMAERGWGRIINIASAHGLRASAFKSAYVAAKHGVVGLTKAVALEAAEQGITVNAICPGYVWTPLVASQVADQAQVHQMSQDRVIREIMLAHQPTRAFVQPEEIAELVAYLCGDLARSITGAALSIDGGWTAQ